MSHNKSLSAMMWNCITKTGALEDMRLLSKLGLLSSALTGQCKPTIGKGIRSNNFSTFSRAVFQKSLNSGDLLGNRNCLGISNKMFGTFEKVVPQTVSPKRCIPNKVTIPDYCRSHLGVPLKRESKKIQIRTPEEILQMKEPCQLAHYVLDRIIFELKPGVSTDDLDEYAHDIITRNNAYPSALGYRQFPKSICTSVNNIACHGIPDNRKLINGDIVCIDVMVYKNGFHGDCAATGLVGSVDQPGRNLVEAAEACMVAGIRECAPNKPFSSIGKAIEACAEKNNVNVVELFTGHGVGRNVHEKPDIFHYYRQDQDSVIMKPGMTFTVEPVVSQGMSSVMILSDGWTYATIDGGRAAQFENTVHITETGVEILTADGDPSYYGWQ